MSTEKVFESPIEERKTPEWDNRIQAENDDKFQQSQTLWEAIKYYKTAILWSLVASSTVVMEASDTLVLGSSFAIPAFKEHFGNPLSSGGFELQAAWQAGTSQAVTVGSISGCFLGAYLVDIFGYKKTLAAGLLWLIPFIGMSSFAPNLPVLMVSELMCGISWGMFSTLAPAYASEVCPTRLRPYLTIYVNVAWALGHFIGAAVLLGAQTLSGVWSYRTAFIIQWIWPVPLMIAIYFAPESPWWHVRRGEVELAERSVRRLAPANEIERARDAVAAMVRTNRIETETKQASSYLECFKGSDLRRTEITCMIWMCQVFCGLSFAGYSTYFLTQAGLPSTAAFAMTMTGYGVATFACIGAWFLVTYADRRTIAFFGMIGLGCGYLLIGGLSIVADNGDINVRWGQGALMIVWVFFYHGTLGSLTYAIIGETSSTRLRNKTIALSRASYNMVGIVSGIVTPYMLNKTAWNWGGKAGFFWGPLNFLCATYVFFRLPEMKNRSFYELDILFSRGISARKFKTTVVDSEGADVSAVVPTVAH